MSFILDALRKSEHERQRSALPSLAHVPVAPAPPQMPRWALFVIALLAAAVLVLAGAWWQSAREPASSAASRTAAGSSSVVERTLPLPAPVAPPAPSTRPPATVAASRSLADAAGSPPDDAPTASVRAPASAPAQAPPQPVPPVDTAALPSAAALVAQGIALPPLRLELHGYAEQPSARFVFINGRKYAEGERLADGPELVAVEPRGAVLSYAGRRFLLMPE